MVVARDDSNFSLSEPEQLQLLQLEQLSSWSSRQPKPEDEVSSDRKSQKVEELPTDWALLRDIKLYDWQEAAVQQWFAAGKRGIIKVVTGAGKTLLALAIAERLQRTDRDLRVAIVVPTVVLLEQWRQEILARSNLPRSAIGVLGAGENDEFDDERRILICVLNSASRKLPFEVRRLSLGERLLLVVDECHRAGAAEMRKLFDAPRAYTVGLSATPEREDDTDDENDSDDTMGRNPDQTVLEREIGPVIYEMTYAEAINGGILAPFIIEHYALSLSGPEQTKYSALSQEITDLRRELETGSRRGLALIRWCRSAGGSKNPSARRLIALISDRKQLLYRAQERFRAVDRLISEATAVDQNSRIIIFHESIAEVMTLFAQLRLRGYAVVAEHSEFPDRLRAEAISLFREGTAQIIVSAKSLIEGFNVPTADMGIVVAASSSVRQRIQTLGRLLRRGAGETKRARLVVLFAANTVDELIYEKADWHAFVGAERNEYFRWKDVLNERPEKQLSPPRAYIPSDSEISDYQLSRGSEYPGRVEGRIYSVDTTGTIFDADKKLIKPDQLLESYLLELPSGGRFIVTPNRFYVLRLAAQSAPIYLGRLNAFPSAETSSNAATLDNLLPGEAYPSKLAHGKTFSVLQRDRRLIAIKQRGQIRFVRPAELEPDPEKRERLEGIQRVLSEVYRSGKQISKIFVNELGHVGYLYQGQAYFVGFAPEGDAGFVFDEM
ncbi:DEAD/DEAH box helicase [Bradyrhizobium sp.]|jgi:superfamily II DNA or RNA helicase|uniref:DEAD/DEAH box helicase n=1 Tax=Bradyrhizobium sp. TaxID=376 RepID=UPI002DDCDC2B|nr:DEAD/DEAH box helicase [Bradyrhizobium sp.]HEV2153004.1 DEAD/DEAH box helicase [Bradyrhizobium sp.]